MGLSGATAIVHRYATWARCGLPALQVNKHAKAQEMARRGLEKQLVRASCSASLGSLLKQDADPMTLPVEERLHALTKAREVRVRGYTRV